jgi:hypothetical protein
MKYMIKAPLPKGIREKLRPTMTEDQFRELIQRKLVEASNG